MKGSLAVIVCFCGGVLLGRCGAVPEGVDFARASFWALLVLLALIGFEFGHKSLSRSVREFRPGIMMVPVATIAGSLLAAVAAALILRGYPMADYLAIGSGMGYYSLSSLLIMQAKAATPLAAELGAIALMANMAREILALAGAPVFRRLFGRYAPVSAAGAASIDIALPAILRACGPEAMAPAVMQGVVLEVAVPLLVMFFCSL